MKCMNQARADSQLTLTCYTAAGQLAPERSRAASGNADSLITQDSAFSVLGGDQSVTKLLEHRYLSAPGVAVWHHMTPHEILHIPDVQLSCDA